MVMGGEIEGGRVRVVSEYSIKLKKGRSGAGSDESLLVHPNPPD